MISTTSRKSRNLGKIIILLTGISLIAGLTLATSQYHELFGKTLPQSGQHHDFLAYYSAGVLSAHHHIEQIYQAAPLIEIQRRIIPQPVGAAGYMPFLNPPPVALFMSWFAGLAEPTARIIWWSLNLALMATIAWNITKNLPAFQRITGFFAFILSLPVYQTLIEGQLSILILAGCLSAITLKRHDHPNLAAISLSLVWLKPQLAVMVLGVLFLSRAWRIILGYLATPTVVFLALLPFTGFKIYLTYLGFLVGVLASHFNGAGTIAPSVWQGSLALTQGINGFFVSLFGQSNLTMVNALTLIAAAALLTPFLILIIRGTKPNIAGTRPILMLAATGAMILLIDPHLYLQDVVLIFAGLPLLPARHYFNGLIAIISLTNVALLDNITHVHLFAFILFVAIITTFIHLLRKDNATNKAKTRLAQI